MKIRKSLIIGVAVILLIGTVSVALIWRGERLAPIEQNRRQMFEQHATISEQARESFDQRYNRLPPESKATDELARALELKTSLTLVPRSDGGREARIDMPDKYARLILMWDNSGKSLGYAWEIQTPAANNVSWARYLATQDD